MVDWDWIPRVAAFNDDFQSGSRMNHRQVVRGLSMAKPFARAAVEDARLSDRYRAVAGLSNTPVELLSIIQQTAHCKCTENRDRIYGILGMTTVRSLARLNATRIDDSYNVHQLDLSLPVDYNRSVSCVFIDAAAWITQTHQSLSILLMEATYGGTIDGEALPSWCPNWSRPFSLGKCTEFFGHAIRFIENNVVITDDNRLRIRGSKLATVSSRQSEPADSEGVWDYATLRRNEEAIWLQDRLEAKFEFLVDGNISVGDQVLFTEFCKCPLTLRALEGDVYQYTGWVNDFPFMNTRERRLKNAKLVQNAVFEDIDIV